jgi:hypothetical protein
MSLDHFVMTEPNQPDAVNPAIALWVTIETQWHRVTDLERATTQKPESETGTARLKPDRMTG